MVSEKMKRKLLTRYEADKLLTSNRWFIRFHSPTPPFYSVCYRSTRCCLLQGVLVETPHAAMLPDDVQGPEQLLGLLFFVLIILGGCRQNENNSSLALLLHSALLA